MISNNVYAYCKEDICLIENYDKAIKDKTQVWDCHHRLEIDLDLLSKELIEKGLYFNRPVSELLFLTRDEHRRLHSIDGVCHNKGKVGLHNTEIHNRNISKAKKDFYSEKINRQNKSEEMKGKHKYRRHMTNGINRVFVKPEQIEYYLNLGYHLGRK